MTADQTPVAGCPCCKGEDAFPNVYALCDDCLSASLAGEYPHDCAHEQNCAVHGSAS
jgi:hypothetical protein